MRMPFTFVFNAEFFGGYPEFPPRNYLILSNKYKMGILLFCRRPQKRARILIARNQNPQTRIPKRYAVWSWLVKRKEKKEGVAPF